MTTKMNRGKSNNKNRSSIRFAPGTKKGAYKTNAKGKNKTPAPTQPDPTTLTVHSPSALAKASTKESITSLHESLRPMATIYVKKLITLFATEQGFKQKALRLGNATFIPRSIRWTFNLTGTSSVTDSTIFKSYSAEANALITETQTKLKAIIVQNTALELKTAQQKILKTTCEATAFLALAFATSKKVDISGFNCYYYFSYALSTTEFTKRLEEAGTTLAAISDGISINTPVLINDGEPAVYSDTHKEFRQIIKAYS
jgi:hypothetical protein